MGSVVGSGISNMLFGGRSHGNDNVEQQQQQPMQQRLDESPAICGADKDALMRYLAYYSLTFKMSRCFWFERLLSSFQHLESVQD
jgi:hypothetical protein